ncbi:MAG: FAD-binding oxidoreductase [Hyphomicrobiales bacterium]
MPTDSQHERDRFLSACQALLGAGMVMTGTEAQEKYGANSVGHQAAIAGAVLPGSQADVVAIVTLANQHNVALYPISTGHNWGYGGATPHGDDAVIVDLHRMNRIIAVDRDLGIAIVEPGVTTGQLYEHLVASGLDYMVPVTGAGPDNSLIGNALERGVGLVPTSDHFQAVMSLTAVLPDGRVYSPALPQDKPTDIGHLYKWGVGPYLDGLFAQGAFGIVTQATIALVPRPETAVLFAYDLAGRYPDEAVNFVREASKRYGRNLSCLSTMNKLRCLSTSPSEKPERLLDWKVVGVIYGDRAVVKAVKRGLRELARKSGLKGRTVSLPLLIAVSRRIAALPAAIASSRFGRYLAYSAELAEFFLGKPTELAVKHVAYGGGGTSPLNPDRDGIGLMWYAPLIPLRAEALRQFIDMAEPILKEHGFDFSITFLSFGWHCVDGTLLLKYDRANPADCWRAKSCYATLFEAGKRHGFIPYRVGLQGMKLLVDETMPFWQVTRDVKRALDPNGILSPGRYGLDADAG